ncbi:unnamed protein product, partial [Ectocarpus sp. 8 AP-2014]
GEGPGGVGTEEEGGLPSKARRRLLRVLPVVRGLHDPVGALMTLRGAGCWGSGGAAAGAVRERARGSVVFSRADDDDRRYGGG